MCELCLLWFAVFCFVFVCVYFYSLVSLNQCCVESSKLHEAVRANTQQQHTVHTKQLNQSNSFRYRIIYRIYAQTEQCMKRITKWTEKKKKKKTKLNHNQYKNKISSMNASIKMKATTCDNIFFFCWFWCQHNDLHSHNNK